MCVIFDGDPPTIRDFESHRDMALWALRMGIKLHPVYYLAGQLHHVTREGAPVLLIEGGLCGLAERKPVELLDSWDLDDLGPAAI
jgi:hypothetical protein